MNRAIWSVALAMLMLLFAYAMGEAGYRILGLWSSISLTYAACAAVWLLAAAAMLTGGIWTLASLGRNRIPLWIGGSATAVSGLVLVAGVLTYVVPCSGPD